MPFKQNKDGTFTSDPNGTLNLPKGPSSWQATPGEVHTNPDGRRFTIGPDGKPVWIDKPGKAGTGSTKNLDSLFKG